METLENLDTSSAFLRRSTAALFRGVGFHFISALSAVFFGWLNRLSFDSALLLSGILRLVLVLLLSLWSAASMVSWLCNCFGFVLCITSFTFGLPHSFACFGLGISFTLPPFQLSSWFLHRPRIRFLISCIDLHFGFTGLGFIGSLGGSMRRASFGFITFLHYRFGTFRFLPALISAFPFSLWSLHHFIAKAVVV